MNRLTYQKRDGNYSIRFDLGNLQQVDIKAMNKLGELEDIEEKLGIDLIKAVELCKQVNSNKVVYTKESWGIDTLKIPDKLDIELFSHKLYKNSRGMYVSLDLYEYGKTWTLDKKDFTKEVLEE